MVEARTLGVAPTDLPVPSVAPTRHSMSNEKGRSMKAMVTVRAEVPQSSKELLGGLEVEVGDAEVGCCGSVPQPDRVSSEECWEPPAVPMAA